MRLRHRPPRIGPQATRHPAGLPHLDDGAIAVMRWLRDNKIDYVLVGPVAEVVRGRARARGPVAIVPAPYGRNLQRLARALWAAHARRRVDTAEGTVPIKVTEERLAAGERLPLRCGSYDLDIEARGTGAPHYQELLYEATRTDIEAGLAVEVASPEDLEHFAQMRETGRSPEIRITRGRPVAPHELDHELEHEHEHEHEHDPDSPPLDG